MLDFRGGESMEFFASKLNKLSMFEHICKEKIQMDADKSYTTSAIRLLKKAKEGHVYYMGTGKHAAYIRLINGKYEYLELQSPYENENGWTRFSKNPKNTFTKRFKTEIDNSYGFEKISYLVDINDFCRNEEFKHIVGYINTKASEQNRGIYGRRR